MAFAETGHRREGRPDLPVSLLIVLHALRLECEKSMELTASSHHSCFFCCSRESRDEAALSESVRTEVALSESVPTSSVREHDTTWSPTVPSVCFRTVEQ